MYLHQSDRSPRANMNNAFLKNISFKINNLRAAKRLDLVFYRLEKHQQHLKQKQIKKRENN